jgi:CHAT domain-containing protein
LWIDPTEVRELCERSDKLEKEISDKKAKLELVFPEYAELITPSSVAMKDITSNLNPSEALVLFVSLPSRYQLPEENYVLTATQTVMRLSKLNLSAAALAREVAALRCGLDAELWDDGGTAARCRGLVEGEPKRDQYGDIMGETLPFDIARAHALYKTLFRDVEDLIRSKSLLIVPSGALTQLPFHVLVTTAAEGDSVKAAGWLAKSHAVAILPALSSLMALRRVSKPSTAPRPLIGFGNPLLNGDPLNRPWEANWAKLAKAPERQVCSVLADPEVTGATRRARSVLRMVMSGGMADLAHLKSQSPLYDTADELCSVARELKLSVDDIFLGNRATEARIKQLNQDGKLAQYRVLHFATHGAVTGEIKGTSEPGLILTPPQEQSDLDDGYLSASEVAELKLNADWVILSACNTAAGGANGAEALSGLARAFIYAGARALSVSH